MVAALATNLSALVGRSEYKYEDESESENEEEEREERAKVICARNVDGLKFHCRTDVGGMMEARVMTTVRERGSSPPTIMMSFSCAA